MPGASLLGGVIAAAGALAMGASIRSLRDLAQTSHGHEILIVWVLLGLACLGALLCLHLTLIWVLAAAIMLAGPASRTGAALLGPLRVLAPRLARRLASGAAVATAATALTLAPGMASSDQLTTDQEPSALPVTRSAELLSTEAPPTDPAPEAAAPVSGGPGTGDASSGAPLPPLGWGGGPSPAATDGVVTTAPDAGASGRDISDSDPDGPPPAPVRTVVVHQGDSLWSISDGLLGPGASDPAQIAATWPLLHETNRDVIGDDPDRLRPGQQLTVPAAMTTQDMP
ncbi:LysM peptidoglycan-binding domain-containing protein [Brachybacterium vulturis]|nr:LysM domain-containing protein [Brachybacterium vulturis]